MSDGFRKPIRDLIGCEDAEVLSVEKINDHGKRQQRYIALTPTEFFSIKKPMFGGYSIRRRVTYEQITGLVRHSDDPLFVVKFDHALPNDYRYSLNANDSPNFCRMLLQRKPLLCIWTINIDLFIITRIKHSRGNKEFLDVFAMQQDDRNTYLESGAEGANRA